MKNTPPADKTAQSNNIVSRPPVVAVVGHIDHGKSTLLDYIRKTNVVATEAGGITQHMSAYEVEHQTADGDKRRITFLDTPGHEAFQAMRNRGANISDIAILVVSAEEGVKPQTLEAIKSIKEAGVPFVVAINKIDRSNANPDRVKQELGEHEVFLESYGGTVPSVNVSAKTGEGVNDLLDLILLVADVENLTGDAGGPASGFALESRLDPQAGAKVTLVIKNGTLQRGDFIGTGGLAAKIKKMEDFLGHELAQASFSSPVRIFGFSAVPPVGQKFEILPNKRAAEQYTATFQTVAVPAPARDEPEAGEIVDLPLVVKSASHGTLEAVLNEIQKITDERVRFKIVGNGVGTVTDTDLKMLIGSTHPLVAAFNVKIDKSAQDLADRHGVSAQSFDIIYKLTAWLTAELLARRPRLTEEIITGKAKILKIFSQDKNKQVLGGLVQQGLFKKGGGVKIWRREAELGRGKIIELQAQKISATEVPEGEQFGALIETKIMISEGDKLEAVELLVH